MPLFEPPEAGELPPLALLDDPPDHSGAYSEESLEAMSRLVEIKLLECSGRLLNFAGRDSSVAICVECPLNSRN